MCLSIGKTIEYELLIASWFGSLGDLTIGTHQEFTGYLLAVEDAAIRLRGQMWYMDIMSIGITTVGIQAFYTSSSVLDFSFVHP